MQTYQYSHAIRYVGGLHRLNGTINSVISAFPGPSWPQSFGRKITVQYSTWYGTVRYFLGTPTYLSRGVVRNPYNSLVDHTAIATHHKRRIFSLMWNSTVSCCRRGFAADLLCIHKTKRTSNQPAAEAYCRTVIVRGLVIHRRVEAPPT